MYLPDLLWKYRRPITLILLIGLSCLLMIDSLHRRWVSRASREIVLGAVSPVQKTSESVYDGGRNALSIIPDFFRTRAQNVALKKHVGQLEQEIADLREQLLQERRLIGLTAFANATQGPKIIARVIGASPTAWFSTVIIDKGASDGVRKYLPALSSSGLAGYVVEVYGKTSKLLLLTDSNSRVGVVVQRTRARGVVQGNDEGGCVLKYLEATADVQTGDVLLTSGGSRIYPAGLLVGRVGEVKGKPGTLFKWADVLPVTDFGKIEEVAIIVVALPQEIEPGSGTESN
ncbi:MAG: rod shape-determining protein MreC [Candidatus Lindowbacteria bacterium]|nr:rod shape-determining protein MreC [Candidatus Lindowbacteria bacterium]